MLVLVLDLMQKLVLVLVLDLMQKLVLVLVLVLELVLIVWLCLGACWVCRIMQRTLEWLWVARCAC